MCFQQGFNFVETHSDRFQYFLLPSLGLSAFSFCKHARTPTIKELQSSMFYVKNTTIILLLYSIASFKFRKAFLIEFIMYLLVLVI